MNVSLLKKALPHAIAVLVFLIVAVVYCRPVLDGKVVYQSDMLQWKGMAQQSFDFKEKHGYFPLWSESAFGGMPAYTIAIGSQSKFSFGYLEYILTLGLPQPIGYFYLACICFYILMMVLRVNPWIGILTSLAYAYSSYDPIIIVTGHVTKMEALAFAPGVLAGLFLLFRGRYLWGTTLLTIFFGFQLGTQHLQVVYYTLLSMGLLTIFFLVDSGKKGRIREAVIAIALAAVAGAIGYGTSTLATLPVQEYSKETMRGGRTELSNGGTGKQEGKGGLSKEYAFQWSYGIGETLTLAVPGIYGGSNGGKEIGDNSKFADRLTQEFNAPEETGLQYANQSAYWGAQPFTSGPVYLGAVLCFLFLFGLIYYKGWIKWGLLSIVILGVLLAWGKNFSSLNYFLFDHFPFYNKFRAPALALVMPQLAFPILAALGLDALLAGKEPREEVWKKFKTTAYLTAGLLVLLVGFYFMAGYQGGQDAELKERFVQGKMQQLSQSRQTGVDAQQQALATGNALIKAIQDDRRSLYGSDLVRTILLMGIAAALLGLYIKGKVKAPILLGALIILCSYDLLAVDTRYLSQDNYSDPADFEASLAATPADQQIKRDPDQNFRVFDESSQSPFQDARASYHHNSLGGYSPAKLGLYQDLIDSQLQKGNMQVFNMLNTRYFIQQDPQTRQPVARVNPSAFGPCWLVKAVHYVKDGSEEMKALDNINLRDTVIVQQQFASSIKFIPVPDSSASIRLVENANDKITYKFSSRTNQFAVFSEVYYDKGWNAYLDGNKANYCRVDYLLRGMAIPAGEHTIEFRFEPVSFARGNAISTWASIIIYLLLIVAVVVSIRKKEFSITDK